MILHHTATDYFDIFVWTSAADEIDMAIVDISWDASIKQWHLLVRSRDLDADHAWRRWETAVEKRRREKALPHAEYLDDGGSR